MDYKTAVSSSHVVLVEFYATWCPHCNRMMPIMEEVKEDLEGIAKVIQLDVDMNDKLAEKEEADTLPTFIIYKDGKEVWRETGEIARKTLSDKVRSFLE